MYTHTPVYIYIYIYMYTCIIIKSGEHIKSKLLAVLDKSCLSIYLSIYPSIYLSRCNT